MAKKTNYNKKKGSNQPQNVQGTAKKDTAAGNAATAKNGTASGNDTAAKNAATARKSGTGKRVPVKSKLTDTPLHWGYMLPIALVFTVVPLISCYIKHITNLTDFDWFTPAGEAAEFFLYYKMVALIVIGVYLVAALIAKGVFFEEKLPWQKMLVPLAIYTVLVILSTVFSPYKEYSLNGSYEQFEPVWVLVTCVTVSTKLGGAVVRNRARRRLREVFRLAQPDLKRGYDVILVARGRSVNGPYQKLTAAFYKACGQVGLLRGKNV